MDMQHVYERMDALQEYGSKTAKYDRFKAEIEFKSEGRNLLYLWSHAGIIKYFIRKREEGVDILFNDAWEWLYAQPSPERRELDRFIKKISAAMEEIGDGDSEIVRDLYRKLFDLRETASNHLLEYKAQPGGGAS